MILSLLLDDNLRFVDISSFKNFSVLLREHIEQIEESKASEEIYERYYEMLMNQKVSLKEIRAVYRRDLRKDTINAHENTSVHVDCAYGNCEKDHSRLELSKLVSKLSLPFRFEVETEDLRKDYKDIDVESQLGDPHRKIENLKAQWVSSIFLHSGKSLYLYYHLNSDLKADAWYQHWVLT